MGVGRVIFSFVCLIGWVSLAQAELKVASFHPLVSDIARNIGGSEVEVIDLLPPGSNPHRFDPSVRDFVRASNCQLLLASGKGMEPYIDKVRKNLKPGQVLLEAGKKIPSLLIEEGEAFACCPHHSAGKIDPHWWHSVPNMMRASRAMMKEFSRLDPTNADVYRANEKVYRKRLKELHKWVKSEVSAIPRAKRYLVTTHAAFGYFCKDYGFKQIPILGESYEGGVSPKYLAETIELIRSKKIKMIFPERGVNPKSADIIVKETGVTKAPPLIPDGISIPGKMGQKYEEMMRINVRSILNLVN